MSVGGTSSRATSRAPFSPGEAYQAVSPLKDVIVVGSTPTTTSTKIYTTITPYMADTSATYTLASGAYGRYPFYGELLTVKLPVYPDPEGTVITVGALLSSVSGVVAVRGSFSSIFRRVYGLYSGAQRTSLV